MAMAAEGPDRVHPERWAGKLPRRMGFNDDFFPRARRTGGQPPTGSEAERLENWLGTRLNALDGGLRPDGSNAATVLVIQVGQQPPVEEKAPFRRAGGVLETYEPGLQEAGGSSKTLPFRSTESRQVSESEKLEGWVLQELRAHGGRWVGAAIPVVYGTSEPVAAQGSPDGWTSRLSAAVPLGRASRTAAPPSAVEAKVAIQFVPSKNGFNPLLLAEYAAVKVAYWSEAEPLDVLLARHGIDEIRWRNHETWLRDALTSSAHEGDAELLHGVTSHLREARLARNPVAAHTDDELERYATLRATIEGAGEDGEDSVLLKESMSRREWTELQSQWSEKLSCDPTLPRTLRKAIGRARRNLQEAQLLLPAS